MPNSAGYTLHNLIYFSRLLRAAGLEVQPDGNSNLVSATQWISISRRQDFYYAARSLLIRRQQDIEVFDRAFELFWQARAGMSSENDSEVESQPSIDYDPRSLQHEETAAIGFTPRIRYSPAEALRHKDFAELIPDEMERIKPLLAELTWRLGKRRTRRWRGGSGTDIDVRTMLRQSLRYGGEPLLAPRRRRRPRPRRLVVIADISGSMERYSSLLLHFIFGLSQSLNPWPEAFVFGTRLTRITRHMHGRDVEHAMSKVARHVPDWSGGTRIGLALKTFNFYWTRRVLAKGAVVLLVSDGWDRGDEQLLRTEMARLQRSSHRLMWLNPLLGSTDYKPLTRGMRQALPYVDDFLPVHNLSSLEDLAGRLESLEKHRPVRKQQSTQFLERQSAVVQRG